MSRRKKWWVAKRRADLEKQRIELLFLAKLRAGKIPAGMAEARMIAETMAVGMDEPTARAALAKRSVLECSDVGLDKEIASFERNTAALAAYEATSVVDIWGAELDEFLAALDVERVKTHKRNFYAKEKPNKRLKM